MVRLSLLSLVICCEFQFITSSNKLAPAAPATLPHKPRLHCRTSGPAPNRGNHMHATFNEFCDGLNNVYLPCDGDAFLAIRWAVLFAICPDRHIAQAATRHSQACPKQNSAFYWRSLRCRFSRRERAKLTRK